MRFPSFALAIFSLTFGLLISCRPATDPTMTSPLVNWQAMSFTCRHEKDLLPLPDSEAETLYQEANALYRLGMTQGRSADLANSVKLLKLAADRGHAKAMNNLVLAYLNGEGVKQSDSEAVAWAERLAERNIGMGYYHLGVFLEQGIGVKTDGKAALTYFRKAADLGNAQGQLVVGKKFAEAVVQGPEREAGFQITRMMLQCALDQSLAEAGYELGMHLRVFEKKIPEALIAFQAAGKLGHSQALWALHTLFEEGAAGLSPDPVRAVCYARLSEEANADRAKSFPNLDKICPLPPRPMPSSA